ncbi:MAG: hypothetical protein JXQ73_19150 [Phycisphaerae bacterium]|nr:hypothetical protein [Phycisphaerae bacterium]
MSDKLMNDTRRTPTALRIARCLAMLGAGSVILQTGSCITDLVRLFTEQIFLTYLSGVADVIFYNLLNI